MSDGMRRCSETWFDDECILIAPAVQVTGTAYVLVCYVVTWATTFLPRRNAVCQRRYEISQ